MIAICRIITICAIVANCHGIVMSASLEPLASPPADTAAPLADGYLADRFDSVAEKLLRVRREAASVIYGQEEVIEQTLIAILAGGHALLVGYPGLAKTRLVETFARALGLQERRIQCTPDLMPADILGSEVLDQDEEGRKHFRFIGGPVFTQLLMADEINRASPRTQSALLQAMQEGRVTVAGKPRVLPTPFHTLATQNPLEHEGTYPLPEAQLDRFLLQVDVSYPDMVSEREVLLQTTGVEQPEASPVLTSDELIEAQNLVRSLPIGEDILAAILELVRRARPEGADADPRIRSEISWGPGPRAGQALVLASRARALLHGRTAPGLQDVHALAIPVLSHRMALNFRARAEGVSLVERIRSLYDDLG
ncbi:MAG: MoxR family ATPase [Alphaproteobacteria bacterium]|nr:MoxR family ATPase [Alphaproteobacteria bacterium]